MPSECQDLKKFLSILDSSIANRGCAPPIRVIRSEKRSTPVYKFKIKTNSRLITFVLPDREKARKLYKYLKSKGSVSVQGKEPKLFGRN